MFFLNENSNKNSDNQKMGDSELKPIKIGIIGGGPAGVSLVMQLVKQIKAANYMGSVDIHVYEKSNQIGAGLPYAYHQDTYILNLPANVMEPMSGQNGQFTQWYEKKYGSLKTQFPPRHYFAEYLAVLWKSLLVEAKEAGINIHEHLNSEVSNITKLNHDTFMISTHNHSKTCDYIALCTGHNLEPDTYQKLIGYPNYQHIPWHEINNQGIQHITLIGTRLTAIDQVLRLVAKGYQGKMLMVSRNGLLPAVLSKQVPPYKLKYLTLDALKTIKGNNEHVSLDKVMELFWEEISHAMGEEIDFDKIIKSHEDIYPTQIKMRISANAEFENYRLISIAIIFSFFLRA